MRMTFLQAEWRMLTMANYAVDSNVLKPYLPFKTEIDLWNDTCYVSLVGFCFRNTRVLGLKIPFHTRFEEINLRFYVRYNDYDTWKRGVVFIKEIVPKPALTFIANAVYGEHYETMPIDFSHTTNHISQTVEYRWKKGRWNSLKITADKKANQVRQGSEEEFITEHYWGYTKITGNKTREYGVEHPKWSVYATNEYTIDVDFGSVYGPHFHFLTYARPVSVFLADGSEIFVKTGRRVLPPLSRTPPHGHIALLDHKFAGVNFEEKDKERDQ